MKRLFKKNQVIITILTVMIAVAGYLNYSGKLFKPAKDKTDDTDTMLAERELLDISGESLQSVNGDIIDGDGEIEGTPGEAVLTSAGLSPSVASAKLLREQVRSQNKETLQNIIDNQALTGGEKQAAVDRLVKMTQFAEQEVSIEMLMASKGFSEAVVSITENSADIVVDREELTDACRAQIEDIVTRKTDIPPEKIVITPVSSGEE